MIASLTGKITYKSPALRKDSYFVISVVGVGYKVYTPVSHLQKVTEGEEATVYTYLSVSERALDLYGFLNPADKTFFMLLLDVPGIGPKSALGILEKTSMAEIQQAIIDDDPELLTKMSGIGTKTAEKIIVALKDKIAALPSPSGAGGAIRSGDSDVFDALQSFGYSASEIRKALSEVEGTLTESSERIKAALKILGGKK